MTPFLKEQLSKKAKAINEWLDRLLPPPGKKPAILHQALRYCVFSGGKRLRPFMVLSAYEWAGGDQSGSEIDKVYLAACGVEAIHTYSLIHDDLPAMDNDDLRRGKPTCHRVFGESIAVLAGDALHALAFEWLAKTENPKIPLEVAQAIGSDGLVGGQVMDILMEGRPIDEETVKYIHSHKTAALFVASVRIGAILAGAKKEELDALTNYAYNFGLGFQITDDILDIKGETKKLGKKVGADIELDKATYPRIIGLEKSYELAKKLIEKAKSSLPDDHDNRVFIELADFIIKRSY